MAQNKKSFTQNEKDLDCFSAVLVLSGYDKEEEPTSQQELKEILENTNKFDLISKLSEIQPEDIIIFKEKTGGLNPYKHAYVVKNSKRETVLTRPIKGQKVTLTNLPLEMKRKKTAHFKTLVYRERMEDEDKPMMRSNSSTRNNARKNVKNDARREKLARKTEENKENSEDEEDEDNMVFVEED